MKPYKFYFIDGEYSDKAVIAAGEKMPGTFQFKGSKDLYHNTGKYNEKENAIEYSCDPKWPELIMETPEFRALAQWSDFKKVEKNSS